MAHEMDHEAELRALIHDLASPLAVAQGQLELAVEEAERSVDKDEKVLSRLSKAQNAVGKAVAMLDEKRKRMPARGTK